MLLLASLAIFSQSATNKDTCKIVLSCATAKKVALDIARGDSALAELKEVQEQLALTKKTVKYQHNVIDAYALKEQNYQEQINLYLKKESNYKEVVCGLEKDTRRLKTTVKVLGFSVTITGTTALILYLIR